MKELVGRLSAYDPEIGDAVRVISYFDELLAHRGGLETIVRGVAVLAGAPARLTMTSRQLPLRVMPNGRRGDPVGPPDDDWQSASLVDLGATLWLERPEPKAGVDSMILERAAIALRATLDRAPLRQQTIRSNDPALVEIVVDPTSNPAARAQAARALGIKQGQLVRAIARTGEIHLEIIKLGGEVTPPPPGGRAGVGPAVTLEGAPRSAVQAALALRFTAEATPSNPSSQVVYSDTLGILTILTEIADRGCDHPDLDALRTFINHGPPWLLDTLSALATTESLRAAARHLIIHHSSLQNRLNQISKALAWDVTTPSGKLRLQITLLLWRLSPR